MRTDNKTRNYPGDPNKLIELSKQDDDTARYLLALTELSRLLDALVPERVTEEQINNMSFLS